LKKSNEIEIKTFNLVFSFVESILARFKSKNIKNPTTYLASELGTSRAYISKVFGGERNFTVKTLISMANAADLEIEILLKDKKTSQVFNYMQIATVDTEVEVINLEKQISKAKTPDYGIEFFQKVHEMTAIHWKKQWVDKNIGVQVDNNWDFFIPILAPTRVSLDPTRESLDITLDLKQELNSILSSYNETVPSNKTYIIK
jgi:transcriptional regulator with XRE-family HTH domain